MIGIFWLLFILIICLFLSYKRIEYKTSSAALGASIVIFTLFGPSFFWSMILWLIFLPLLCLNIVALRKEYLTVPIYNSLKNKLPKLSSTEREALEAGGVWWEG